MTLPWTGILVNPNSDFWDDQSKFSFREGQSLFTKIPPNSKHPSLFQLILLTKRRHARRNTIERRVQTQIWVIIELQQHYVFWNLWHFLSTELSFFEVHILWHCCIIFGRFEIMPFDKKLEGLYSLLRIFGQPLHSQFRCIGL